MTSAGNDSIRFGVLTMVTRPAGWGIWGASAFVQFGFCGCVGSGVGVQPGGGEAAIGAPSALNNTPAEAVVSFETMVLLISLTFSASSRDTPAPSHPATLLAMMLFVTITPSHRSGLSGNRSN